jgi:hypothetical protein
MNAFAVCALGLQIRIDGNLEGSIRSMYDGARTTGNLSAQFKTDFLNLFREPDRQGAYQLYSQCLIDTLSPRKALIDSAAIPSASIQMLQPRGPGDPAGTVVISFTGRDAVNVGYSQFRILSILHQCSGNLDHTEFYTRVFGPYKPYDANTRQMYIQEAEVFSRWRQVVETLKQQGMYCVISPSMKVAYKVDFENPEGDHFTRYFVASLGWNGPYPNLQAGQASQNEWQFFSDAQTRIKANGSIGMTDLQSDINVLRTYFR